MGEFAQRLAEAAKHARASSKDGVRVLIGVEEHGIRISASGDRWGDRLYRTDITFIEIEQCRFNMLINAIDKAASEVRTADGTT